MTTCEECTTCQGAGCDERLCLSDWPAPVCGHGDLLCGGCCITEHGEAA